MQIEAVSRAGALLGETPVWNDVEQRLYWADVLGASLHAFHPATGQNEQVSFDRNLYSFAFRKSGGLIAACESGFAYVELEDARFTILHGTPGGDEFYLNDGRCDRAGNFYAGTVNRSYRRDGALFRLDPYGAVTQVVGGAIASNGLAFGLDNKTMYYADSRRNVVWLFDFEMCCGRATNQRVFAEVLRPDGAAIDAAGCYWIASYLSGEVLRFTPDGKCDRRISLPVLTPTMCAFGGRDLDVLFVTTGKLRLSDQQLREQPLAGSLFAIRDLGLQGVPEPRFGA